MAFELYDYQRDALKLVRYRRRKKQKSALVVLPTGCGKTIVFVQEMIACTGNVLLLVHREDLLLQAKEKLLIIHPDLDIGIVGFGYNEWSHRVILGGIQTLSHNENRLAQVERFAPELVVVDECHHAVSDSYRRVFAVCPDAFLFGVTATPNRADELDIRAIFGEPVYERSLPEMIEERYLSDLICTQVKVPTSINGVRITRKGDYDEAELSAVINRDDRNILIAEACMDPKNGGPDIPSVTFCVNKAHARGLTAAYLEAGIRAVYILDDTPSDVRLDYYKKFAAREITMLVNVSVLSEGWDADVRRLVLASPTKACSRYIQQLGRGTRIAPGKEHCIVLDVTDNSAEHGLEPVTAREVLMLPELLPMQSVKEALEIKARSIQAGAEHTPEQGKVIETRADGELVYQKRQIRRIYEWRNLKNGGYIVDAEYSQIMLMPRSNGKYDVGIRYKEMPGSAPSDFYASENLPLSWAQSLAEQTARKIENGQGHLVDPTASWRFAKITDGQKAQLAMLHIPIPKGCLQGEASDLISRGFASKRKRGRPKRKVS